MNSTLSSTPNALKPSRKKSFALFLLLLLSLTASAQVSFGVRGGVNLNFVSMKFKDVQNKSTSNYKIESNFALHPGGFVKIPFNKNFSFKPGLDFVVRGGGRTEKERVSIYYIDLPFSFQYDITDKLFIEAGPVASWRVHARAYAFGLQKTISVTPTIEPFAIGLSVGAGYFVGPKLAVHASAYRALNKAWDVTFRDVDNRPDGSISYFPGNVSVGVEYYFKRDVKE